MDVKQVMSMRYKKEKGTLQSEMKNELEKYLSDDCEEANDDAFEILQFERTNKRDILFLPKWLEMYLLC